MWAAASAKPMAQTSTTPPPAITIAPEIFCRTLALIRSMVLPSKPTHIIAFMAGSAVGAVSAAEAGRAEARRRKPPPGFGWPVAHRLFDHFGRVLALATDLSARLRALSRKVSAVCPARAFMSFVQDWLRSPTSLVSFSREARSCSMSFRRASVSLAIFISFSRGGANGASTDFRSMKHVNRAFGSHALWMMQTPMPEELPSARAVIAVKVSG